jgi:hypothetical protein
MVEVASKEKGNVCDSASVKYIVTHVSIPLHGGLMVVHQELATVRPICVTCR